MFKVGDKIKGVACDIIGCEGIIRKVKMDRYVIEITKAGGNSSWQEGEWKVGELINRPTFWEDCIQLLISSDELNKRRTIKMKLNNMMKCLLDEDTKKLVKANIVYDDLELSDEGKDALFAILFKEKKAELVKVAEEKIAAEKE